MRGANKLSQVSVGAAVYKYLYGADHARVLKVVPQSSGPDKVTVYLGPEAEIDVAVSMGLEHTGTINREVLFTDRMVSVMRSRHPLAKGKLTLERFLTTRHLKVSMAPTDIRFADDVLSKANVERDVALNVPHWLLVPHVLATTDYVAVMPGAFAAAVQTRSLVVRDLPFAGKTFDWCLYWHRRHQEDSANRWLRERIKAASRVRSWKMQT